MTVKAKIDTKTVIRALHTLECDEGRVTQERVAEYLRAPLDDVKDAVRELEAKRIFKRKRSKGETIVRSWGK